MEKEIEEIIISLPKLLKISNKQLMISLIKKVLITFDFTIFSRREPILLQCDLLKKIKARYIQNTEIFNGLLFKDIDVKHIFISGINKYNIKKLEADKEKGNIFLIFFHSSEVELVYAINLNDFVAMNNIQNQFDFINCFCLNKPF